MKKQTSAGVRERQIAEFGDDHEIDASQLLVKPASLSSTVFGLQFVHQIHGAEESNPAAIIDSVNTDFCHQMRLSAASSADKNPISGPIQKMGITCKSAQVEGRAWQMPSGEWVCVDLPTK